MWALPRRAAGVRGDAARVLPVALIPPLLAGLAGRRRRACWPPTRSRPGCCGGSGASGDALLTVTFAAVPVVVAMTLLLAALRCVRPIRAYVGVQFLLLPVGPPGAGRRGRAGRRWPARRHDRLVGAGGVGAAGLPHPRRRPARVWAGARRCVRAAPTGRTFWRFALPRAASAAIDAGSMWVGVLLTSVLAGPADAGVFGAVGRYVLAGQLAMQGLRVAVVAAAVPAARAGRAGRGGGRAPAVDHLGAGAVLAGLPAAGRLRARPSSSCSGRSSPPARRR